MLDAIRAMPSGARVSGYARMHASDTHAHHTTRPSLTRNYTGGRSGAGTGVAGQGAGQDGSIRQEAASE